MAAASTALTREAPLHVDELGVRPLVGDDAERLERHAALRARPRVVLADLGIHRADPDGAGRRGHRRGRGGREILLRIGRELVAALRVAEVDRCCPACVWLPPLGCAGSTVMPQTGSRALGSDVVDGGSIADNISRVRRRGRGRGLTAPAKFDTVRGCGACSRCGSCGASSPRRRRRRSRPAACARDRRRAAARPRRRAPSARPTAATPPGRRARSPIQSRTCAASSSSRTRRPRPAPPASRRRAPTRRRPRARSSACTSAPRRDGRSASSHVAPYPRRPE